MMYSCGATNYVQYSGCLEFVKDYLLLKEHVKSGSGGRKDFRSPTPEIENCLLLAAGLYRLAQGEGARIEKNLPQASTQLQVLEVTVRDALNHVAEDYGSIVARAKRCIKDCIKDTKDSFPGSVVSRAPKHPTDLKPDTEEQF
ncbi:hypothetical protein QAD02_021304 [Eretmocerus hayati]|uniref:Uncharacterized protein n=1 Tax=Eretmocerus hayati TaxID=131215 RepID=A0ACC2PRR2_9HYME|nr:hypothetical protein QAD02_021304 [Eretmocerus hayati]